MVGPSAGRDGSDDLLDDEMRARIEDLAERLGARPEDLPVLGSVRGESTPYCVRGPDGWHLTARERDRILSDRSTPDPDEFLRWVAESISERMSWRLHPPGSPDFSRASWQAQYEILASIDQMWADTWLSSMRSRLIDAGATADVLAMLPTPT
ncbi:Imm63 family immunity protein [Gordonia hankookensis]|uniref:Immunity protein 63 domain-containing protein n=1 Tax=Gordonia hankookensis TaxID=589403 RepID=A0ABR7W670_9ACTN|nr:Imm63 family immunity protein [Gordonia hankookensis]MBD1318322.1 hypothetical protein [Gordonia hankookensis]